MFGRIALVAAASARMPRWPRRCRPTTRAATQGPRRRRRRPSRRVRRRASPLCSPRAPRTRCATSSGETGGSSAPRRRGRACRPRGWSAVPSSRSRSAISPGLARDILEKALAAEWTPQLVALYGDLPPHLEPAERAAEARARFERGERWLLEHERDAQLLAVLGRLCAHAELWGKARSFLEASLSFEEGRGAHLDLARLAERLGEGAEAERHYRRAAELT